MTVQIKDSIIPRKDEGYAISRYTGNAPFNFSDYFERPFIFFTACWRRHVASYKIVNRELILDSLRVFKETETPPTINGVKPTFVDFIDTKIPYYKNLKMKMNYTGRILVKSGYINLGLRPVFQDAQVKRLIEYNFVFGELQQEEDLSWLTEKFRQELLEYAKQNIDTEEMMNKILGHSIRNKKNIENAKQIIDHAKEIILKEGLAGLPKSVNYTLFEGFKFKDREFNKNFNERLYLNYDLSGFEW